jgi:hypothetical protein
MTLIYETKLLGMSVRVFSDRVEYKPGLGSGVQIISVNQIASIKLGQWLVNRLVIETTGGREYVITTSKKKEVAEAIHQAQSALRSQSLHQVSANSVADEIAKLAKLRDQGVLSNQEFEHQKTSLIGGRAVSPVLSVAPMDAGRATSFEAVTARPAVTPRPASSLMQKVKRAGLAAVALLVALAILGAIVGPEEKAAKPIATVTAIPVEATREDPDNHLLSDSEKEFFGATVLYLKTVSDEDVRMTAVMAAAPSGGSTDDDIKDAIEHARSADEASYTNDYRSVSVPAGLAALDKKIRRSKSLHDATFNEMLAFWDDSSTGHITKGGSMLNRAVLLANECVNDANLAMMGLAEKRRKGDLSKTAKH